MATEEPKFDLIKKTQNYEIRNYSDIPCIQTIKNSGEDTAFRRLFEYISGSNSTSSKINMTAPVIEFESVNGKAMNFFLPESYSIQNAPDPNDSNVKVVTFKGGTFAIIKYSGRSSDSNFLKYSKILKDILKKDRIKIIDKEIKATYNGPMTPFFLRRNEVMFRINLN